MHSTLSKNVYCYPKETVVTVTGIPLRQHYNRYCIIRRNSCLINGLIRDICDDLNIDIKKGFNVTLAQGDRQITVWARNVFANVGFDLMDRFHTQSEPATLKLIFFFPLNDCQKVDLLERDMTTLSLT